MTNPAIAAAIVQLIEQRERILFADIANLADARGPYEIMLMANAVAWAGLSEDAAHAIKTLVADGVVRFVPSEWWEYVVAGETLKLPVVRDAHALLRPDATPHWCPVAIEPGPAWRKRPGRRQRARRPDANHDVHAGF